MFADPQGYIRALRRQALLGQADEKTFQAAGGLRLAVDETAGFLLVAVDEMEAFVSRYEQEVADIVSQPRDPEPATPFERFRRAAVTAEQAITRTALRHSEYFPLAERLQAAETRFRGALQAARARAVASLDAPSAEDSEPSKVALQAHFQSCYPERPALRIERFRTLLGAHSREIYFFDLLDDAGERTSLVLRRDRAQNVTPATVAEERPIMEALRARGFPIPEIVSSSADQAILGRPFLAMQHVEGRELAEEARIRPDLVIPLAAELLARLHNVPAAGLPCPLQLLTEPMETAWSRLIDRTYETWRRFRPAPSATVERAYRWLRSNAACAGRHITCVHGDFQLGNMLVAEGAISALIDFEVCHLGNPAEDLLAIRPRIEPYMQWSAFYELYRRAGGIGVSEEELVFCSIWIPFYYISICVISYDLFQKHGYDVSVGVNGLVALNQLLDFTAQALMRATGNTSPATT